MLIFVNSELIVRASTSTSTSTSTSSHRDSHHRYVVKDGKRFKFQTWHTFLPKSFRRLRPTFLSRTPNTISVWTNLNILPKYTPLNREMCILTPPSATSFLYITAARCWSTQCPQLGRYPDTCTYPFVP